MDHIGKSLGILSELEIINTLSNFKKLGRGIGEKVRILIMTSYMTNWYWRNGLKLWITV